MPLVDHRGSPLTGERAPKAATQSHPSTLSMLGMPRVQVPTWDADAAVRQGYQTNVWVWRGVNVIADAIASLPFVSGALRGPQTRLQTMLGPPPGGPNPVIPAHRLWHHAVVSWMTTGRFAWEIEMDPSGSIAALWPLSASHLRAEVAEGTSAYFSGFRIGSGAQTVRLRPDQVLYHWRPSQTDYRQSESPLQAARIDVAIATMQDRYDYAFLVNDARPAAIVVTEQMGSAEEHQEWSQAFVNQHAGPDRSGRLAFLETAGDDAHKAIAVETLGLTQRDARFPEREKAKIRAICVALGVPLTIMGDASDRTFANAREETLGFWQHTVLPIVRELETAINMQLAPRLGSPVGHFDLSGVAALRTDRPVVELPITDLVAQGIVTHDEAREYYGLPPLPEPPVIVTPVTPVVALAVDHDTIRESAWERLAAKVVRSVQSRRTGRRGRRAESRGADAMWEAVWTRSHWEAEAAAVAEDLAALGVAMDDGEVERFLAEAERAVAAYLEGEDLVARTMVPAAASVSSIDARAMLVAADRGGER